MTRWIKTTQAVYLAIYDEHKSILGVFATISEDDLWMTAWGFRGSDEPLIKSEAVGRRDKTTHYDPRTWSYFIASHHGGTER